MERMSWFYPVVVISLFTLSFFFWRWYYSRKSDSEYDIDYGAPESDDERKEGDSAILEKLLANPSAQQDILAGSNDKYDWTQNRTEVEVYVHLEADVTRKEVKCTIEKDSLSVEVRGEVIVDGYLYSHVVPDECNWQLDGDGSQRKVWISLFKETPTTKNQHWKCVVVGDEQVDTGSLGPPVHALDIDNKAAIQEAMAKVHKYK